MAAFPGRTDRSGELWADHTDRFFASAFAHISCAGGNDALDGCFVYRGLGSVCDGTRDGAHSPALEPVWKVRDPGADPAGRSGYTGLRDSYFTASGTASVHAHAAPDRGKL